MAPLRIRRMSPADIDEIWRLEQDLFTMPWSRASLLFEAGDNRNALSIVGLDEDGIAGYAIGWFVSDEFHIGNVAVARDKQGRGFGKQLVEYMLREALGRGTSVATLEVRVSNVKAIRLYRKYGFKGVAIRKRYYGDSGEDALVMLAELESRGKGREGAEDVADERE
jgi:ribosomal-protein-alanine N-acetyltransferase